MKDSFELSAAEEASNLKRAYFAAETRLLDIVGYRGYQNSLDSAYLSLIKEPNHPRPEWDQIGDKAAELRKEANDPEVYMLIIDEIHRLRREIENTIPEAVRGEIDFNKASIAIGILLSPKN